MKAILIVALVTASFTAQADGQKTFTASNPAWQAECGSCHLAYPPQLLPARSWRAIMAGLDKHFGSDASVDAKAAAEISAFLEKNAGRDRDNTAQPVLRISDTRWFRHEHDEVPSAVWRNPKVKSASNCAACHIGATQGDFSEHSVRIPR